MTKKRICQILFIGLTFASILNACKQESSQNSIQFDETKYFKKIESKMELTHSQLRGDYTLGKKGQTLRFLLKNIDVSPVTVNEWFMNETSNINLFYAFCEHGKANEIKDSNWKQAWPLSDASLGNKNAKRRMPLVLQPNNAAMLEVPLEFLETLKPPQKKARYYLAMYAQISLNTLQTKSEIFEMPVFPKVVDVEIK